MSIIHKLKKVGKDIFEKDRYINHGGCCVYAAKVGRALQDLGYEVRVVHPGIGAGKIAQRLSAQNEQS